MSTANESLLPYSKDIKRAPSSFKRKAFKTVYWLSLGATALYGVRSYLGISAEVPGSASTLNVGCSSVQKLIPPADPRFSELAYFRTPEYKNHSLDVWSGAVRVYTPTFDDLGEVGDDPRWDVFYDYEKYLLKAFPHLTNSSELVHVNTHGLVFIIHGSDESLKPVVFMGHQDVVPVLPETESQWTYPPTSATFDGQWLWGRGAGDNKDHHIASMEAADKLLSQGFKPKRSIIFALGFDEESYGVQGAGRISKYLLERFGPDSLYFIVDEGGLIQETYGARFALPATGEKGHIQMTVDLITTGGHSSVPPRHTAIGIMSRLVALLEDNPYAVKLTESNPFYEALQCFAAKGKTIPKSLTKNVAKMATSKSAKKKVLKALDDDINTRFLVSTSQDVGVINGGLKINALPEKVTIQIDHRVGYDSSPEEVRQNVLTQVKKIAKQFNLGVETTGDGYSTLAVSWPVDIPSGKFVVTGETGLEPAPKSPSSGPAWDVLAGSIKHVYEDFAIFPNSSPDVDPEINVAPGMMTPNSDTRYYWDLTKNIFRFWPARSDALLNFHTVDERVDLDSHVEGVAFFYTLLRNVYEADTIDD